jgi:hypothetical protein
MISEALDFLSTADRTFEILAGFAAGCPTTDTGNPSLSPYIARYETEERTEITRFLSARIRSLLPSNEGSRWREDGEIFRLRIV